MGELVGAVEACKSLRASLAGYLVHYDGDLGDDADLSGAIAPGRNIKER